MLRCLSYHRWEQMGAALRHNGPVDDLPIPIVSCDDAEDATTFSAAQHAGSAASGMPWHAGSISRPLRVSSTWEGGSGAYKWQSSRYPHLRAILFDFPRWVAWQSLSCVRRGSRTASYSLAVIMNTMCCRQARCGVVVRQSACYSPESCRRVLTRLPRHAATG